MSYIVFQQSNEAEAVIVLDNINYKIALSDAKFQEAFSIQALTQKFFVTVNNQYKSWQDLGSEFV